MARGDGWTLERLIDPFESDRFLTDYYEEKVLHVARENPDYYRSLLTLEDIDRALTTLHLQAPAVHMANAAKPELKNEHYTYPSGLIDAARLYQEYMDGGTIVLNQLEGSLPALMDLCRSMEKQFSSRFQCNIYLTPRDAQGLKAHYDTHDVFVLQVAGTKDWTIYQTPIQRPFRGQEFQPGVYVPGEKSMEFRLRPGDMVYLPRGAMHDAVSTEADSCHITLGVLPSSWMDLILEAVAHVGIEDADLRRALPAGFAAQGYDRTKARAYFEEMLGRIAKSANFDRALEHFAEDLVSTRHPLLLGQLMQVQRLPSMTVEDRAAPRKNLMYYLSKDAERVSVSAYGGQISLPLHAAEALEHALTTTSYRIGDLPGDLDDPGKLVLIRKLVREGLVELL